MYKLGIVLIGLLYCSNQQQQKSCINQKETVIVSRFLVPEGYVRKQADTASFSAYLRQLPLQKHNSLIYLYNGKLKTNQHIHEAIIDLDIGEKDLQQCADAVMRLRAEYLYKKKQYSKIHFNFTNGVRANFVDYTEGYRPVFKANKINWIKSAKKSLSYSTFREYMNMVFTYSGTASLSKELKPVASLKDIIPGDVFIKGGSPGHAVIVVDVAKHKSTEDIVFMLAQSYMPAQNIHILKNLNNSESSPWYSINEISDKLYTPEWTFDKNTLMRFSD